MDKHLRSIANIQYIALGMPTLSLYVPFYAGISGVPYPHTIGDESADSVSAFWKFRKVQSLAFKGFKANVGLVQKVYADVAKVISDMQAEMEAEFAGNPDPQLIQNFTNESVRLALKASDDLRLLLEEQYLSKDFEQLKNKYHDLLTTIIFAKQRFPGL